MMKRIVIALAASLWATSAQAVTLQYDFVAGDFRAGSVVEEVIGSLQIDFDFNTTVEDQTEGITLLSSNLPVGSPLSFSYNIDQDNLIIGGLNAGANGLEFGSADFALTITEATGPSPQFFSFLYTSPLTPARFFRAFSGSVELADVTPPSAVPLPASVLFLLTGLGALGLLRRLKKLSLAGDGAVPATA